VEARRHPRRRLAGEARPRRRHRQRLAVNAARPEGESR
jgi:hypothetical protein